MAEAVLAGLKEGDKAPDFKARTEDGKEVRLSDFLGKKNLVLYFYPKDDTPGCTKEACGFRDDFKKFSDTDTLIFGVSVDSAESHRKFKEKFKLPFPLLVDEDKTLAKTYGALGEKGYASRVTFLIGKEGRIKKVFPKVQVDGHSSELLATLA